MQLLVKVDADESVRFELKRLELELFAANSPDTSEPLRSATFLLTRGGPNDALQRIPFSFGITPGEAERIKIVARGYSSNDEGAAVKIERKVVTTFRTDTVAWALIYLYKECYAQPRLCDTLDATCSPDSNLHGQCGPVDEVDATRNEPKGTPPSIVFPESGGCESATLCARPDYVCVDSTTTGYECRGQFAEWPMPRDASDSPWPPHYTGNGQTIHDDITGLTWQRSIPQTYEGCGDTSGTQANACRWDQAKRYCDTLDLADATDWRLPTKIELESIISETNSKPALDPELGFTLFVTRGTRMLEFWTASPLVRDALADRAWFVSFDHGLSDFAKLNEQKLVRCVRGATTRPGTPADRYRIDLAADTVTDQRTKLIWDRSVGPQFDSHDEAEGYCRERGTRLPSKRELLTLIDPIRLPPAIDPCFPALPKACFWSSSASTSSAERAAWFVVCSWSGWSSDDLTLREATEIEASDRQEFRQTYTRCVADERWNDAHR